MTADVEVAVIGAGVVGLAIGAALSQRGRDVLVIEQHDRIGTETSARSSEVIHAGLYYPPGSLRGKLCVEGKARLYAFAQEAGVTVKRCGKLLVATDRTEIPRLDAIAKTAAQNGVHDLERLTPEAIKTLEPEVSAVAGLLSPSTGVVDSHGLMVALEGLLTSHDGAVVLNTRVAGLERCADGDYAILTRSQGKSGIGNAGSGKHGSEGERGQLTARSVVLAAGLGGSALAGTIAWRPGYTPPRTYPAKGHYFSLTGRQPFRHLVYPLPQGAWLGVHLTLDTAGRAKFGPDIAWKATVDYAFEGEGGAREARFCAEIRRYWPGLPDGALQPDYTGVRPKIYREGEPAADFAIHGPTEHGLPGVIALYGIESPGLTASLALGELVASMLPDV